MGDVVTLGVGCSRIWGAALIPSPWPWGHGDRGRGQESKAWAIGGCGDPQSVSFSGLPPTNLFQAPQSLTLIGTSRAFPSGDPRD